MTSKRLGWQPHYRTGIERFDDDHRRLTRLLHRLNHLMTSQPETPLTFDLLEHFTQSCEKHFRDEEQWMAEHRYPIPLAEAHRDDHSLLIDILRPDDRPTSPDATRGAEMLMVFLRRWLTHHVERFDTRLRPDTDIDEPRVA
jgi:hemerythrin-like metal-binding protein